MSDTIYLYIKTHNSTGLKYFGKTIQDPFKYKGSGLYWKRHLKKHGDDVTTTIFGVFDKESVSAHAIKFSRENNISESKEWANMIDENGINGGSKSEDHTPESRAKMSKNRKGKPSWTGLHHTEETKQLQSIKAKERCERDGAPIGAWKPGCPSWNKGKNLSEEHIKNLKISLLKQKRYTCPHCNKTLFAGNYTRWHGDKCKEKQNAKQ